MQKVKYSPFLKESEHYWEWAESTPVQPIPPGVAKEGAGSEMRTPIMHYGVIMPVYMAIIRYLTAMKAGKGMRLIELGSGSGRPLAYLKSKFPELEVWGVDYSEHGVAYAKKAYGKHGVKFKHVPAQSTALKSGHFDFVISSHVIEHVPKHEGLDFMKETHRLLKKGGYAFIGTPERRRCQELYSKNPTDHKKLRLVPPHEHEYLLKELKELGQQVFPEKNVRVDALINPTFMKAFHSSIEKFKPSTPLRKYTVNLAYRTMRDTAPRPVFDTITRLGASRQMKKLDITFKDILFDNSIAAESGKVPHNLLLVCQK
jgi:2-polyprenyl-3-methyl-5-hydroxy-6-metoxy-1,4-benzoquinol methylase